MVKIRVDSSYNQFYHKFDCRKLDGFIWLGCCFLFLYGFNTRDKIKMDEQQYLKLNRDFLVEGSFPKLKNTLLDTLITLLIIIPSIILFHGWSFIWIFPLILITLTGKPKWFCRYIFFHWNNMYKIQDKLLDYNNERIKEIKSLIRASTQK